MNGLKVLVAGAATAVIIAAFRDFETGGWLSPALPGRTPAAPEEEPVLGYDGMDQETVIDWLADAKLDTGTIRRIIAYEKATRHREPVLAAAEDLM